jgi:hypothetical protein
MNTTATPFQLDKIVPAANQRLVFRGEGMERTTLRFDGKYDVIRGVDVNQVSFVGLTFARLHLGVSQGVVVAADESTVTLDISPGFPTPDLIMDDPSRLAAGAGKVLVFDRKMQMRCVVWIAYLLA